MVLIILDFHLGSYNVDLTLSVDPLYISFITKINDSCYQLCGSGIELHLEEGKKLIICRLTYCSKLVDDCCTFMTSVTDI